MKLHTLIPLSSAIALSFGSGCDGDDQEKDIFDESLSEKARKQSKDICDKIEACGVSYNQELFSARRTAECETYYGALLGPFREQTASCDTVVQTYLDCAMGRPCSEVQFTFRGFAGCEDEIIALDGCLLATSEIENLRTSRATRHSFLYWKLVADCSEYGYEDQYAERKSDAEIMRRALEARAYLAGLKSVSEFCYEGSLRFDDCLFQYYRAICEDPTAYGETYISDFECYAQLIAEEDRLERECDPDSANGEL